LVDLGSTSGTYIKIHKDIERQICNDSTYLIGAETQFHVIGLQGRPQSKYKDQKYFFECLTREVAKGIVVHGLEANELASF
jgi:hypothetical protein